LPQCKHNDCNQEPGGPLNRKPQADWAYSCLRSPATRTSRTTTKKAIKNSQKTIKTQPRDTCAMRHAQDSCWRGNAVNRLTQSPSTTKQVRAATTTAKTEITIIILIKKIEGGLRYCVLCKSDHQQYRGKSQSSQKSKTGETPPTFLDDDLDFTDTVLMGLDSMDADLNRPDDVTNLFGFSM
jgi:hypothetical protein